MPPKKNGSPAILMLALLISIVFLIFLQLFCTPVMLPAIAKDLGLNTVQLGLIWGMSTFGGLFLSLPTGLLGDRIGPRWGIFVIAVISAVALGLRGFAKDTALMAAMMFIGGGVVGGLPSLVTKAIFTWFPPTQVGLANGAVSSIGRIGMAVGAAISATVVATALHSWQNTFLLYGAVLLVFAVLWLILIHEPKNLGGTAGAYFREALVKSVKTRDVWFCAVVYIGLVGLNVGFAGYLAIYLQNIGWRVVTSSLALTVYFLMGFLSGFIISALSDKTRLRKIFVIVPVLMYVSAIGLIAATKSASYIWTLTIIAGFTYAGIGPVLNTMIAEIKGIGARYAGTAISIGSGLGGGAGLVFAEVSGKLALTNAVLPFIFGSLTCLVCLIPFFFTRETGTRNYRSG